MNAEISETIQATILGLGMQIPEIPAQRKFVSAECHAHSNAHNPSKIGSYSFYARIKILTEIYCSRQYLSIDPKKVCHAHSNAHKTPKPVAPTIFMLNKKF